MEASNNIPNSIITNNNHTESIDNSNILPSIQQNQSIDIAALAHSQQNGSIERNDSDDKSVILNRLSQIKDYKRQVLDMMDQMKQEAPDNTVDKETLRKMINAYDSFKSQEDEYMALLKNLLAKKQELVFDAINGVDQAMEISGTSDVNIEASRDLLKNMTKQQENVKAVLGQLEARSNQLSGNESSNGPRDLNAEQDLILARETVESQANALAAKRRELEALKDRLSLVNALSEKTADADELSENDPLYNNELSEQSAIEKKVRQANISSGETSGEKKRLMQQIAQTLAQLETSVDEHTADAENLPREESQGDGTAPGQSNRLTGTEIRMSLENKFSELLATKKRIAEIQSLMHALEEKSSSMLQEEVSASSTLATPKKPPSMMNNGIPPIAKTSNTLFGNATQNAPFNSESEKNDLIEIRRQLLSMNDNQLASLASRRQNAPNLQQQQRNQQKPILNNVKNSSADFTPCRLSNIPIPIDQADQDDDEYELVQSELLESSIEPNPRRTVGLSGPEPINQTTNQTRMINFRRNNDFASSQSQHVTSRLNNQTASSKFNTNLHGNNGPITDPMLDINALNSSSNDQDDRYNQLSQHIESIRSIFESIMVPPSGQQSARIPNRMSASMPATGAMNNLMTSSMMSTASAGQDTIAAAVNQQQLAMHLLQCQQQMQSQQRELIKLNAMYQQLAAAHYGGAAPTPRGPNVASMVNSFDGRPLSSNTLYNLLAPNPYLTSNSYDPNSIYQQPIINRGVARSVSGDMQEFHRNLDRHSRYRSLDRSQQHQRRSSSILSDTRALQNRAGSMTGDAEFDGLRESIYSEVATLISQNEQRPHYLLELFRELQLLSSDHLRSRAFRAIRQILNRYLTAENEPQNDRLEELVRDLSRDMNNSNGTSDDEQPNNTNTNRQRRAPRATARSADRESTVTRHHNRAPGQKTPPIYAGQTMYARSANMSTVSNSPSRGYGRSINNGPPTWMSQQMQVNQVDPRLRKIYADLRQFLMDNNDPVTVCQGQFLTFVRKFSLALIASAKCIPAQGEAIFVHKKLASGLQQMLIQFNGRRLVDCNEEMINAIMNLIKEHVDLFTMMQSIDSAIQEPTGYATSRNQRLNLFDLNSPSEIGGNDNNGIGPAVYNEELANVENALAFIDDELRISALGNNEDCSLTPTDEGYGQRSTMPKF